LVTGALAPHSDRQLLLLLLAASYAATTEVDGMDIFANVSKESVPFPLGRGNGTEACVPTRWEFPRTPGVALGLVHVEAEEHWRVVDEAISDLFITQSAFLPTENDAELHLFCGALPLVAPSVPTTAIFYLIK